MEMLLFYFGFCIGFLFFSLFENYIFKNRIKNIKNRVKNEVFLETQTILLKEMEEKIKTLDDTLKREYLEIVLNTAENLEKEIKIN